MKFFAALVLLLTPTVVIAAAAGSSSKGSFPQIWSAVSGTSPELKAKRLTEEAAEVSKDRLSRHWLPRLHGEARAFNSDDPAINFMNILGERQATVQDFNPSQLNSPGAHTYTQTTIGAELPLYEGGQSRAALQAQEKVFEAKKLESTSAKLKLYSETVRLYGELISFTQQKEVLSGLSEQVDNIIKKYRLGTKANPVGYSGLLTLRSLNNRIAVQLDAVGSNIKSTKRALELLSGQPLSESDLPRSVSLNSFLKTYAPFSREDSDISAETKAKLILAEAAQHKSQAEQAKYLPHVGLFAQDNLYTGERGSASGYSAGAYLRWSLGATDIGSVKEAKLEASAAEAQAYATKLNDQIRKTTASSALETIERRLSLLEENQNLLSEQRSVSETLFRSGSLSVQQLAEVLSKSADLVEAKAYTEKDYILARLELLTRSQFDVNPETIGSLK